MAHQIDLCIVGGGPAGMMAGLLFARAGVKTLVLEKHADFLRDFRGDTVHPSTLRLFDELGLLNRLLCRPHDKVRSVSAHVEGRAYKVADLSGFDPRWNFIAMMPQWEFLDFLAEAASAYSAFTLRRRAEATDLIRDGGRITGTVVNGEPVLSRLVILADGRNSALRQKAALPLRRIGAPMDVFWFRLPKAVSAENLTAGYFAAGRIVVLIDRGDYWQCAYLFAKGEGERIRAGPLAAFRDEVARAAPPVADRVAALSDWAEVKLLTVALDRLERWHRPGLLAIGDAAHAMSPIGGVGINLAIQDAVAAANILAGPMAAGDDLDALLHDVEARRRFPVRAVQGFQNLVQRRIVAPVLAEGGRPIDPPLALKLLDRFALLRRIPAAFIGFGPRPEHIRSPQPPPGVSVP